MGWPSEKLRGICLRGRRKSLRTSAVSVLEIAEVRMDEAENKGEGRRWTLVLGRAESARLPWGAMRL